MDSSTELQHTLELAFHRAPVGLCVSRHRTIEICNEAFAQMFGYAQADLMGHSLARLYPSLDEFTHIGKLGLPVMQTTGTYSDERIMCRSDGALFWCHVAGRALDRADPFAHAVWMFEDISQRRPVGAALTIREREIAQHIVTGATSKQIARLLEISHRTVEAHRARLMRKLDATTTGELVARLLGAPR
jgi:PAS domain S-box-containing protein